MQSLVSTTKVVCAIRSSKAGGVWGWGARGCGYHLHWEPGSREYREHGGRERVGANRGRDGVMLLKDPPSPAQDVFEAAGRLHAGTGDFRRRRRERQRGPRCGLRVRRLQQRRGGGGLHEAARAPVPEGDKFCPPPAPQHRAAPAVRHDPRHCGRVVRGGMFPVVRQPCLHVHAPREVDRQQGREAGRPGWVEGRGGGRHKLHGEPGDLGWRRRDGRGGDRNGLQPGGRSFRDITGQ